MPPKRRSQEQGSQPDGPELLAEIPAAEIPAPTVESNANNIKAIMDAISRIEGSISRKDSAETMSDNSDQKNRKRGANDDDSVSVASAKSKYSRKSRKGESFSDSDESDESDDDDSVPYSAYGTNIGSTVKQKLREKVKKDIFVDFSKLLPTTLDDFQDEVMLKFKNNRTRLYKKRSYKELFYHDWSFAYDIYMSIYVETAITASDAIKITKDMLTYKSRVTQMYKKGQAWAKFDIHYRRLREADRAPWDKLRNSLFWQYSSTEGNRDTFRPQDRNNNPWHRTQNNSTQKQQTPQASTSNAKSHMYTADGNKVPFGYCLTFHTRKRKCPHGESCTYKHRCPECDSKHPVFVKCSEQDNGQSGNKREAPFRQ